MDNTAISRRRALALLLGGSRLLPGNPSGEPVRLALSESLLEEVNINDARAAMTIWLNKMSDEMKLNIIFSPNVFDTTEEIISRARGGRFDSVCLNILEYRQIANFLDPGLIVAESPERYVLLAKRESGSAQLAHLRGQRLCMLKGPKMRVAPAWIGNLLDAAHLGSPEHFFGSIIMETKLPRVILPVFFGQTDACITTKASFDTMCEMNPQVGAKLQVVATSPPMVIAFYVFHKNFHTSINREFARILSEFRNNAAGRQLATLYHFDQLSIFDGRCLESALSELEVAERRRSAAGVSGKGPA